MAWKQVFEDLEACRSLIHHFDTRVLEVRSAVRENPGFTLRLCIHTIVKPLSGDGNAIVGCGRWQSIYISALIHYDINIPPSIIDAETGPSWWCISGSICLVSVFRSPISFWDTSPLKIRHCRHLETLAGRSSSETEGSSHVLELHNNAEMLLKGSGNEPAIRSESQSF
jgi:hypothetical protein